MGDLCTKKAWGGDITSRSKSSYKHNTDTEKNHHILIITNTNKGKDNLNVSQVESQLINTSSPNGTYIYYSKSIDKGISFHVTHSWTKWNNKLSFHVIVVMRAQFHDPSAEKRGKRV